MSEPLHYLSIYELSKLLETKVISPVEVTRHLLDRIDALDGELKSFATVMSEQALDEARQAEIEILSGNYRGLLHGVPVAVKDLCYTLGTRTMGGTAVLENFIPKFDATVVKAIRDAGGIMLGKLNLTEGAMAGYNPARQVPQNPWRKDHWPGASSSGSGVATAAGLAYATLGSDTGGSIRHPSAVCGTVGLKPTWGRVSRFGVLDLAQSLDHVGPLTRSAIDAGIMMQVISGADAKDPTALIDPVPNMLDGINDGVKGLRLGWDPEYSSRDLETDFAEAVVDGLQVMEKLGATVIEVSMPKKLREYMAAWPTLCSSEAADAHREYYPARSAEYGLWFQEWLRRGTQFSAADYARAQEARQACNGELSKTMSSIDLLLCPSTPRAAYPYTEKDAYGPIPENRDPWDSRFTVPMDFAGVPTIAMPCGLNNNGLPLSMQFVGHHLSEPLLVQAGAAYQANTEWHTLRPPGWQ
ncbi:MAG: Asp-tRNA(Asn)/Glu-tRNA(Gln) amidotransferase GatCAB subunit A [Rhodospirillaceae bacterium]|nr:Asp-tRNA(Asn)/Glu-tRNA(Gln) amidotransferase GatCAB subunit A [Rhodospirillaceae bacterium]|tara:strand:- start:825 stop:2234 length:1410 start_codon:yes stop_codon:yes gene_type:complete